MGWLPVVYVDSGGDVLISETTEVLPTEVRITKVYRSYTTEEQNSILASAKLTAKQQIDDAAGEARSRYITVSSGQDAVYIMKEQQARAYKDSGYTGPVPALIQSDAEAYGTTAQQAADAIITLSDTWIDIAAAIEKQRLISKKQIADSSDAAEIKSIANAAILQLQLL
jgi:hypothetical protein